MALMHHGYMSLYEPPHMHTQVRKNQMVEIHRKFVLSMDGGKDITMSTHCNNVLAVDAAAFKAEAKKEPCIYVVDNDDEEALEVKIR